MNKKEWYRTVQTHLDIDESDLLKMAVCLRCNADDKLIWDVAIDRIESVSYVSYLPGAK